MLFQQNADIVVYWNKCLLCSAGDLINYCYLAACPAATVQDFLERYEVGETVGVGGE